jgi:hypothetical protein
MTQEWIAVVVVCPLCGGKTACAWARGLERDLSLTHGVEKEHGAHTLCVVMMRRLLEPTNSALMIVAGD